MAALNANDFVRSRLRHVNIDNPQPMAAGPLNNNGLDQNSTDQDVLHAINLFFTQVELNRPFQRDGKNIQLQDIVLGIFRRYAPVSEVEIHVRIRYAPCVFYCRKYSTSNRVFIMWDFRHISAAWILAVPSQASLSVAIDSVVGYLW